jgi:Fibronectin type III domain
MVRRVAAAAILACASGKMAAAAEDVNRPPQISGFGQSTAREGDFYYFRPSASDPDGDALTFRIANKPPWAEFNPATGALMGTPGIGSVGFYTNVIVGVTDGQATVALPGFAIDVEQAWNGSATLSWLPPTQRTDGSPLTDLSGYRIRFGIPGGSPNDAWISNPGLTSYVVDNLAPGTYVFAITAFDSFGRESEYSNVVSKAVN